MDVFKWLQTPEGLIKSKIAETIAGNEFVAHFPKAGGTKFIAQVYGNEKHQVTAEIFFNEGPGSLQSVFGSDMKYWRKTNEKLFRCDSHINMKILDTPLGVAGFPYHLSPKQT